MRSRQRDKAGGTLDKLRGRAQEAKGALTGDERSKAKGQGRQTRSAATSATLCASSPGLDLPPRAGDAGVARELSG